MERFYEKDLLWKLITSWNYKPIMYSFSASQPGIRPNILKNQNLQMKSNVLRKFPRRELERIAGLTEVNGF